MKTRKDCTWMVWRSALLAAGLWLGIAGSATSKQPVGGERELVIVDDMDGLLANVGRDHVELVLLPGHYIVPPCPGGLPEEVGNPTCGQMQQGNDSVLASSLHLEVDPRGVPTGEPWGATVVQNCGEIPIDGAADGAVIDCGALPRSNLEYSCLVAGNRSVIRNLTVCNGPPPQCGGTLYGCNGGPFPPGFEGVHRNAITVPGGTTADVEEVRLVNARRGVLITAGSNQLTRGAVRRSLIDGTELAGVFVWAINPVDPGGTGTVNAQLVGEIRANRLARIGRFPLIQEWAFAGGDWNESHVEFRDNIVDSSNFFGITILGLGGGAQHNLATFEVKGGRLDGAIGLGITMAGQGNSNTDNLVLGEVQDLTIANSKPAIQVSLQPGWGTGNYALLEMTGSSYLGADPGEISITDDAGSNFEIAGSTARFLKTNANFDITGALSEFTEE